MTPAARAAAYFRQTGRVMTVRQRRRYRKKVLAHLSIRLPGVSQRLADGADQGSLTAPAPDPAGFRTAGSGVTPEPALGAQDARPGSEGGRFVHTPTAVCLPAAVGASLGGEP